MSDFGPGGPPNDGGPNPPGGFMGQGVEMMSQQPRSSPDYMGQGKPKNMGPMGPGSAWPESSAADLF